LLTARPSLHDTTTYLYHVSRIRSSF
jgi:hypothetical protein